MKYRVFLAGLICMISTQFAHAQLYKWVGPDGKVTYSDTPPPKTASKVETKSLTGSGTSLANLPYELAQAARTAPVVLYTASKCPSCEAARKFLNERGIPFAEKTVTSNEDIDFLKKQSGGSQLPFLMIGRKKQIGFEAGAWGIDLTSSGYPETNKLPRGYANPAPEPAVAPKPPPSDNKPAPKQEQPRPAPSDDKASSPSDFRF